MRSKKTKGDLSVQAIGGTHVVLLGMDLPKKDCPGLLGFALRREDHTEGEKYWLSGYKTFKSVEPFPPLGMLYSTRQHPIQGFTWSDFSAKPEHDYTYEVFALRGTPANPQDAEKVAVNIRTESEHGRTHHVHFNRGAAASQGYTDFLVTNGRSKWDLRHSSGFRAEQPNRLQTSLGAQLAAVGDFAWGLTNLRTRMC